MGLDGVELVMEIEDRYDIRLTDAECSAARTVADVAALIVAHLPKYEGRCPTARAFYEFRQCAMTHGKVMRQAVRPKARLDELFTWGRWSRWRAMRKVNPDLPRLVSRTSMNSITLRFLQLILALVWLLGTLMLAALPVSGSVLVLLVFISVIAVVFAFYWTEDFFFRRHFPRDCVTVADLVRKIAPKYYPGTSAGEHLALGANVLQEVREMIAEQMGIPLDSIKPESQIVRDLHIG